MTKEALIKQLDGIITKNPKSEWSKYQRHIVDETIKILTQESVFDKIRAEIEQLPITDTAVKLVIAVLDKNKAESENNNE